MMIISYKLTKKKQQKLKKKIEKLLNMYDIINFKTISYNLTASGKTFIQSSITC